MIDAVFYITLVKPLMLSDLFRLQMAYTKKGVICALLITLVQALITTYLQDYFAVDVGESVVCIPDGLSLGVILLLGWQYWPFILAGSFFGEMGGTHTLLMDFYQALGLLFSYLMAAILLKRYLRFDIRLQSISDYLKLLFASLSGSLLSSSINIGLLIIGDVAFTEPLADAFRERFIGDFFGFSLITPVVLLLSQNWLQNWSREKIFKFAALLAISFLFGQAVFVGWLKEYVDLTGSGFLIIFIIAFFGYRYGRQGAMIYFSLVILQSILGISNGQGFFSHELITRSVSVPVWIYWGLVGFTGLAISLAVKGYELRRVQLISASESIEQSERRFREIVTNTPILMATYNLRTELTDFVNPFFTSVLGYTSEDFKEPNSWWPTAYPDEVYRKEVQEEWIKRAQASDQGGTPFAPMETQTTCKDGSIKLISWGCFQVSNVMVIYGIDITNQKRVEGILEITSAVYRAIGEAVVIFDAENQILVANDAFLKMTGYSEDELFGFTFADFLIQKNGSRTYSEMFISLDSVGRWEGQAWIKFKSGAGALRFLSIYSTFDEKGAPLQRVALISEVTDQRVARELINQQANFDSLTGLPNRRLMLDRLDQLIKQATRAKTSLAIIYIDIDNFKDINDTRGHDFGDEVLIGVAERLRSDVRDSDTVARIGGDEFVILLSQLDRPEKVDIIVRQILKNLSQPFQIQNHTIYTTASFGISMFPTDGNEGKTLLLAADQAMYEAKSEGKNNLQYFTSALQVKANYRAGVISELRIALEKKQFKLEYQPIYDLKTGACTHAEALLRWHRNNGEVVFPSAFIDIAEESGLILGIGDWVMKEALQFIRTLGAENAPLVAINVSATQFNSSDHSVTQWLEWMRDFGVPPSKIVLEITERMMLMQSHRVRRKISMLQESGCQFSVDDFGTGYSSLASLKNFDFDYLKIDSHFIKALAPDSLDASLVSSMISMAKGLGLESIAEGVETDGQAMLLKEMGCTLVQGYLYSRPMTPEDFIVKFSSRR